MLKLKFISSRATLALSFSQKYILRTISQFQSFFFDIKTVLNKAVCDSHSPLSHVREDKRSCKNNTFSSQTANSRPTTKTLAKLPCTFQTWKYNYERICVIVAPCFLRSDWLIRGESQKCRGRYCGC